MYAKTRKNTWSIGLIAMQVFHTACSVKQAILKL